MPADEKKSQETLMLKSDGTTERLVHRRRTTSHHHEKQAKQEKDKRDRRVSQEKRISQDKQEKRDKQEKLETDKPRLGRTLTSQEESILLPLLQGLLAANGTDTSKLKHENTPFREKELEISKRTSRSNSLAENNDKSKLPFYL